MHYSNENDGTVAITYQVEHPMQGTFVGKDEEGNYVVNKGIVRPPFYDPLTGEFEQESFVSEAAFGKNMQDGGNGKFYKLGEVGKEHCSLAYQTNLFSNLYPAEFIEEDTKCIQNMTVLDLLGRDNKRKVEAGVHPSLLLGDMAPWDLFRKYEVQGIRATVFGSYLVSGQHAEYLDDGTHIDGQLATELKKFFDTEEVYEDQSKVINPPWFKLLRKSAEELAKQCKCRVDDMEHRWFLIHRDPALPDGTSMYPARFGGVLGWDNGGKSKYGVVLNPLDPYWKSAGGDFDGDSACVYAPTKHLVPRKSTTRFDLKLSGRQFESTEVAEQIVEAASNTVTELLGPIDLGAMRLVERGLDTDDMRIITASVAQASVQAKKHPVNAEEVSELAGIVFNQVNEGSNNGEVPYITSFINAMRRATGTEGKLIEWNALVEEVKRGTWDDGTKIEKALVERIKAVNLLFSDVGYFRNNKNVSLPVNIRNNAAAKVSQEVRDEVIYLTNQYVQAVANLVAVRNEGLEEEFVQPFVEDVHVLSDKFRYALYTGKIDGFQVTPRDMQIAVLAYGPHKIAAQHVSAELFEEFGFKTKRMILNLNGHDWKNGEYLVENIDPFSAYVEDYFQFSKDVRTVNLEVINSTKNTMRVVLTISELEE